MINEITLKHCYRNLIAVFEECLSLQAIKAIANLPYRLLLLWNGVDSVER